MEMALNFIENDNRIYTSSESLDDSNDDYNQQLRNRINQLRNTMLDLKAQLKNEKDNWEKEMQQLNASETNQTQPDIVHTNRTTNNEMSNTTVNANLLHGLSLYEDPMDYINVESKNLQRQLAISNYRRHLLEVESMCNLELMRVRQNVTFLQPLRMIASEWESTKEPDECGECLYPTPKSDGHHPLEENKIHELSTSLDIMSNKFAGDMNIFAKASTEPHEMSTPRKSYQSEDIVYNPRSTAWYSDYLTTE